MSPALAAVVACAVYTLACFAVGAFVLRMFVDEKYETGASAAASAFLIGQGLLATILMLAAAVGWFSQGLVIILLAVALLLGVYRRRALTMGVAVGRSLRVGWRRFWRLPLGYKGMALLIALLVMRSIAIGFLPPEPYSDSVSFYLTLPKTIADTGYIRAMPQYETFVAFGLHIETHYAALMALAGYPAAKLFALPAAIAASVLLAAIALRLRIGWRGQMIALAMLWTSTAFNRYIGDGKTDSFAIALGLAAVYWALRIDTRPAARSAAALTGICAALAVIAKFSYLVVLAPMLGLLIAAPTLAHWGRTKARAAVQSLATSMLIAGAAATAVMIPHVIKNAVVLDEPLAPFITSNTDSATVTNQPADDEDTIRRVFLGYPFYLTYAFAGNVDHVSVLLLTFVPLALLLPRRRWRTAGRLTTLIAAGLAGMTVWLAYQPVVFLPRYFLIALIPWLLMMALAADRWLRFPRVEIVPVALIVPSALIVLAISHTDPFLRSTADVITLGWRYASGELSACDFELETADRGCHAAQILNAEAELGDRIFLIAGSRFWLRSDLILCARINDEADALWSTYEGSERWTKLYQMGFRYILLQNTLLPGLLTNELPLHLKPEWLQLETVYEDGDYGLYRLTAVNPPVPQQIACEATRPSYWERVPIGEG